MSNIIDFSESDRHYDEASEWLVRLSEGLADDEKRVLGEWMRQDPANRAALRELAEVWDEMAALSELTAIAPAPLQKNARKRSSQWAIAASLVALAAVLAWQLQPIASEGNLAVSRSDAQSDPQEYRTEVGEQSTIKLSDGSDIVLNTDSHISVELANDRRLIHLTRGELHIDVAPDVSRPLSVIVKDKFVRAVGTAFSVEIVEGQKVELVVTEGQVLVGSLDAADSGATRVPVAAASHSFAVSAGEGLVIEPEAPDIKRFSAAEIEIKLSWRHGSLVFTGESLEEAIGEVSRYTHTELIIVDDELRSKRIAGHFRAGDVGGLLAALRENFGVVHETTSDGKILLRYAARQ